MIITSISSNMGVYSAMARHESAMDRALVRLSSGLRINSAADDPAGLAIREKMRGQISGLQQASRNAQDGISLLQTGEGGLNETHAILQRMRELAVEAANETLTGSDRAGIQREVDQLTQEVDRIAKVTSFNTKTLLRGSVNLSGNALTGGDAQNRASGQITLANAMRPGDWISVGGVVYTFGDGTGGTVAIGNDIGATAANLASALNSQDSARLSATSSFETIRLRTVATGAAGNAISLAYQAARDEVSFSLQIGANTDQNLRISISNMDSGSLGIGLTDTQMPVAPGNDASHGLDMTTTAAANGAITKLDDAIQKVSGERSNMGAVQNRLEHSVSYLDSAAENLSASESRISDADIAMEAANFYRSQILSQAAMAMLAQVNRLRMDAVQKLLG